MTRLGDVVDMTFGYAFKSAEFTESLDDVRLLRGDNIGQGRLRWDSAKRFPLNRAGEVENYRLSLGDVVVAMDRPWISAGLKYAVVREADLPSLLVQRVARLRARDGLDQGYLSAIIGSKAFTDYVVGVQTGSAVPHISGGQLAGFELPALPPIGEQRAIAATLGALDDKIESNRRTIDLAEKLADQHFLSAAATTVGLTEVAALTMGSSPPETHTTRMAKAFPSTRESGTSVVVTPVAASGLLEPSGWRRRTTHSCQCGPQLAT